MSGNVQYGLLSWKGQTSNRQSEDAVVGACRDPLTRDILTLNSHRIGEFVRSSSLLNSNFQNLLTARTSHNPDEIDFPTPTASQNHELKFNGLAF
jgi:hypothetical protein